MIRMLPQIYPKLHLAYISHYCTPAAKERESLEIYKRSFRVLFREAVLMVLVFLKASEVMEA